MKGIQIVIDYFKQRGHVVKVFLPQHVRKKEYSFLEELYKDGTVIFTPSRRIGGRQITSYDDRYIRSPYFYYINRKIKYIFYYIFF